MTMLPYNQGCSLRGGYGWFYRPIFEASEVNIDSPAFNGTDHTSIDMKNSLEYRFSEGYFVAIRRHPKLNGHEFFAVTYLLFIVVRPEIAK